MYNYPSTVESIVSPSSLSYSSTSLSSGAIFSPSFMGSHWAGRRGREGGVWLAARQSVKKIVTGIKLLSCIRALGINGSDEWWILVVDFLLVTI